MDKSKATEMTFTRFFGAGRNATNTLPTNVAIPTHVLIRPKTASPPFCFDFCDLWRLGIG